VCCVMGHEFGTKVGGDVGESRPRPGVKESGGRSGFRGVGTWGRRAGRGGGGG
jgi:hypothetical protein